jgi:hypothetical protein
MQVLEAQPITRSTTQDFLTRVYGWMGAGLALTGVVAYWTVQSGFIFNVLPYLLPLFFGLFALAWVLQSAANRLSPTTAGAGFVVFSGLMGLVLSTIFLAYTEQSIAKVFFITAGTFGGMSLYGMTTRQDLSTVGSTCVMGFWGIFIASLVNLFLVQSDAWTWVISFIGVFVFTGLAAYKNQMLVRMAQQLDQNSREAKTYAIIGALMLYITFINLFQSLLNLFGTRRN